MSQSTYAEIGTTSGVVRPTGLNPIASGVCVGALFLSAGLTTADAQVQNLFQIPARAWTTSGASPIAPRVDLSTVVRRIKDRSGLTWQQIANALGVSRRSVHFWLNGGNVASLNATRIEQFAHAIDEMATDSPTQTRSALLAPQNHGPSVYQSWVAGVHRATRPGSHVSPTDLMNPVEPPRHTRGQAVAGDAAPLELKDF